MELFFGRRRKLSGRLIQKGAQPSRPLPAERPDPFLISGCFMGMWTSEGARAIAVAPGISA